jgi:hypothetical protein
MPCAREQQRRVARRRCEDEDARDGGRHILTSFSKILELPLTADASAAGTRRREFRAERSYRRTLPRAGLRRLHPWRRPR